MKSTKAQRMAVACAKIYFEGKPNVSLELYGHYIKAFVKAYKDKL